MALTHYGYPLPPLGIVASNNVAHGKSHPALYLAGVYRFGVTLRITVNVTSAHLQGWFGWSPGSTGVVVEDAPSGILARDVAGCKVIAVCTPHMRQQLLDSKPDYIVRTSLRASGSYHFPLRWQAD